MFETFAPTGTAVTLKIMQGSTQFGVTITMPESVALPGLYTANHPVSLAEGKYRLDVYDNGLRRDSAVDFYWNGTAEITLLLLHLYTKLAYARHKNKVVINAVTKRETIFDANGTTILSQRDLKGADGLPNSEQIYEARP